jgi:hypothetical protein
MQVLAHRVDWPKTTEAKMRALLVTTFLVWFAFPAAAQGGASLLASPERFVAQQELPDGRTLVVAEGDGEPRSTGSYCVRLYASANPDFPFDDFKVGAVFPRDGQIERLDLHDVNGDGLEELVVVVRSAGSGGYLSARALRIDATHVEVIRSIEGLASNADPLAELSKSRP